MKKQFNNLLYTGLTIVGLPFFLLIVLIVLPVISEKSNNKDAEVEERVKIYDTIPVKKVIKIYDTITIENIKWIERVKPDTLN